METIFLVIVILMAILAVASLVVGVSNDAVNFLNSAIGSKAAPRHIIMIVASLGIIIGAITSSGMMEVARSGVFHPALFTFSEVMMLFLAVMLTNVILLDLFNTLGMPTSTTVSLVFGLLGAAVGVGVFKLSSGSMPLLEDGSVATMNSMINSGNAMAIISGILSSVVLAFISGVVIMYITRLIFSYRYQKKMSTVGVLWCGIALTAISYFAVFKGLKSTSLIPADIMAWMSNNTATLLAMFVMGWSVVMFVLHLLKVNILKVTVLAGTLSLALAFAGNDLVNFIGVFMAAVDSYKIAIATDGGVDMLMGGLNNPVKANFLYMLAAGIIMVVTLWFSKKAQHVSDTEINLARQDSGVERFGSTSVSRGMVRSAINLNRKMESIVPSKVKRYVASRFVPIYDNTPAKDKAPFDLIRATVNLTVASILIAMATSLKLPLSTTYVTFMVAMGSSLADKAWGRESAVYRITGVMTVIAGWFFTGLIAFTIAFAVAAALMWGGMVAVVLLSVTGTILLIRSSLHTSGSKSEKNNNIADVDIDVVTDCSMNVRDTMAQVTAIYNQTLIGLFNEDRKLLKKMVHESEDLFYAARERKYELMPTLLKLQDNYADTGHYYVQIVDYLNEVTKALVHITRPSYDHINNNHEGLSKEQVDDLMSVNERMSEIYEKINYMLRENDYSEFESVLALRDSIFSSLAEAIKSQIRRVKAKQSTTRSSVLYLNIINESKTMVLQSRNLLKSQRYFLFNDTLN